MGPLKMIFPLSLLYTLLSLQLFSQPVLTGANHNPLPGDYRVYRMADAAQFASGDSGINVEWNFSYLETQSLNQTYYKEDSLMPESHLFPGANLGMTDIGNTRTYMLATTDSFSVLGYVPESGGYVQLDNPRRHLAYPFSYGDTIVDVFSGLVMAGDGNTTYDRSGNTEVIADGYGRVRLPIGFISNALRVKTMTSYGDMADGVGVVANYIETRYDWYVPEIHYPVVSYVKLDKYYIGNYAGSVETLAHIDSASAVKIESFLPVNQISLYPNPARDILNLEVTLFAAEHISISISNQLGQQVYHKPETLMGAGKFSVPVEVKDFPSGMYILSLNSGNRVSVKKFVVE